MTSQRQLSCFGLLVVVGGGRRAGRHNELSRNAASLYKHRERIMITLRVYIAAAPTRVSVVFAAAVVVGICCFTCS
jgi:hypothetical protein